MSITTEPTSEINIFDGRKEGMSSWEYPPWGHPLAGGIYPLLISADAVLQPIGTAFCVSAIGLMASASHNARELLRHHRSGDYLLQLDKLPREIPITQAGLSLLSGRLRGNEIDVTVWPLENVLGVQPADLFFALPVPQDDFPYLSFTLSLIFPRIGDKVTCVGYSQPENGKTGALSIEEFRRGLIDPWSSHYRHRFQAIEGTVRNIFTQRFSGYLPSPCFEIDAEIEHGMSGGPAFNNRTGCVCGVASCSSSSFFPRPSSLITPLFAGLSANIELGVPTGQLRADTACGLLDLIAQGLVRTDGSERLLTATPEANGLAFGPMIPREDRPFVFDDFDGLQAGRPAQLETTPVLTLGEGPLGAIDNPTP